MNGAADIADATAVILAGGLGTRLKPVVADRPKPLATVAGRPFLAYLLDQVRAAGIRRAVLCSGHLGDRIEEAFGRSYRGVALEYSRETAPAGTGGALRQALHLLDASPVLVLNGDSYCAVDLADVWLWHHQRPAHATLVAVEVPDASRFGLVEVGSHHRILGFREKSEERRRGLVNGGIYVVRTELLAPIPADRAVSLEREVFPGWTVSGFYAYRTAAAFLDIGTPESFARAAGFVRALAPEAA